jgi:hypothetical protein
LLMCLHTDSTSDIQMDMEHQSGDGI